MNITWRMILALLLASWASSGWSLPWNKDMADQPAAKPQASVAPPQPSGIPIDGGETVPAPATIDDMFEAKDAAASIVNPVPATVASVARGRELYMINCFVCHGAEGQGDGPVIEHFGFTPVALNDAYVQDLADGQIFFTLTRGGIIMPFYRDALSPLERWHVINFLRQVIARQ